MIEANLVKALCSQMNFELYSAYLYLAMAAQAEKLKLPGAANWMHMQAEEELIHANIFFQYLVDRECDIAFEAIAKPAYKASDVLGVFKSAGDHEKIVTKRIQDLAALAMKNGDFTTLNFLNFFLSEQIQEEKSVQQIVDKLELIGKSREGLLYLDNELAVRAKPTPPAAGAGAM